MRTMPLPSANRAVEHFASLVPQMFTLEPPV